MNFLTFIQQNKDLRKLFGQRELKIIEKQLLGINLTQSEKNRLSRDIRRKFACIAQAAKFEADFSLKKGATIKGIITDVQELLRQDILFQHMQKIILYGSTVEQTRTFRSDIDLAVVFDTITERDATLFRRRILGRCPDIVDLQVYNVLPQKIKREIDSKGKILYEK